MAEAQTVADSGADDVAHLAGIYTTQTPGEMTADMQAPDDPELFVPDTTEESAEEPVAKEADKDEPKEGDKPESRVRWTDDGGFEITRGDEKLVLSEHEVERIARKRIGKAHEQAREAKAELAREREARLQAERDAALAKAEAATKPKQSESESDKPWSVKGAERPAMEDFDSVEEWADARDEWKAAQSAPDPQVVEQQTADQAAQAAWLADAAKFSKEALDGERGEEYREYVYENEEAPFFPVFVDLIRDIADDPTAVLIELGKDVATAHEIGQMITEGKGPKAVKAIALVESKIGSKAAASDEDGSPAAEEEPTRPVARPPKPGGGPRRSPADLAAKSTADYFAWRREQGW